MYLLLEKTKFCPSGMKKNAIVTAITTSHLIHQNLEGGGGRGGGGERKRRVKQYRAEPTLTAVSRVHNCQIHRASAALSTSLRLCYLSMLIIQLE